MWIQGYSSKLQKCLVEHPEVVWVEKQPYRAWNLALHNKTISVESHFEPHPHFYYGFLTCPPPIQYHEVLITTHDGEVTRLGQFKTLLTFYHKKATHYILGDKLNG